MPLSIPPLEGLEARVTNVIHVATLETPADKPYGFVYFITIINKSSQTVTLKGRKWIVSEQGTEKLVVEGEGIVGLTPTIPPGDEFSYNSYHVVANDAEVEGSFFGTTESDLLVRVPIPKFLLRLPS